MITDRDKARRPTPIKGRSVVRRVLGRTATAITISRPRRRSPKPRRSLRRPFQGSNRGARRTITSSLKTILLKARRPGVRRAIKPRKGPAQRLKLMAPKLMGLKLVPLKFIPLKLAGQIRTAAHQCSRPGPRRHPNLRRSKDLDWLKPGQSLRLRRHPRPPRLPANRTVCPDTTSTTKNA
jgi:hypothetical protein